MSILVYVNDKPVLLVCDNTVYVKMLECISQKMQEADTGYPYDGAKLHYILDIDDRELSKEVVISIEAVTPVPKAKIKEEKINLYLSYYLFYIILSLQDLNLKEDFMSDFFSPEVWSWIVLPLLIFFARICDVSIGTLRLIFISRSYEKNWLHFLAFFEVIIWLAAIRTDYAEP